MKKQEEKLYKLIVFDKLSGETREIEITSTSEPADLIAGYQYLIGQVGIVNIQLVEKKLKGLLKLAA